MGSLMPNAFGTQRCKTITISLTKEMVAAMDSQISNKLYMSRSEMAREGIRQLLFGISKTPEQIIEEIVRKILLEQELIKVRGRS